MKFLLTFLLGFPLAAQPVYDLLIKNGHVMDPANKRNGRFDLAIVGNKIARVDKELPASHARVVIEAGQYYVTPGLIDIQTHFNEQAGGSNVNPDHNSLRSGVTTAVDAGSSGYKNFAQFKADVIEQSKTRLLAFLNIAGGGASGAKPGGELSEMDAEAAARTVRQYAAFLVGIQSLRAQQSVSEAVDRTVKAAELSNTIAMVDIHPGSDPDLILKHLRPGDIYTHVYGRPAAQPSQSKTVQASMLEARRRGVLFDLGHGSGGFWFRVAAPAVQQGFLPDTISTDIDKNSIMLARANMTTTISKLLNLGMTLEQVIERSTVNPARAIRRSELGTLSEGAIADVAIFELERGEFGFLDSGHGKMLGEKKLRCVLTVRNGAVVWDSEGLSLTDWMKAGPYSNFK